MGALPGDHFDVHVGGGTAIERWLRPVAYQGVPEALLPVELRDDNPLGLPRRFNGVLER